MRNLKSYHPEDLRGKQINIKRANIRQIVRLIDQVAGISARDAKIKRLAERLKTPQMIFDFVNEKVAYEADPDDLQIIRTADKTLRDKRGNCVDFSVLQSALLRAAGVGHFFRIAKYEPGGWQHIYVKTKDGHALDPTIGKERGAANAGKFGQELRALAKFDYMPKVKILGSTKGAFRHPKTDAGRKMAAWLVQNQPVPMKCDQFFKRRGDYGLVGRALNKALTVVKNKNQASDVYNVLWDYVFNVDIKRGLGCNSSARRSEALSFLRANKISLENAAVYGKSASDAGGGEPGLDQSAAYEKCLTEHSKAACDAAFGKSEGGDGNGGNNDKKNIGLPLAIAGAMLLMVSK